MDPVQIFSVAILAALSWRAFRETRSSQKEKADDKPVSSPEYLNFQVDRYAIDRLRNPSLPPLPKPIATPEERESWLASEAYSRSLYIQSSPWDEISSGDGFLYEYNSGHGPTIWTEQRLREFARLGYEVKELDSKNLPAFRGIRVNEYLERIDRIWADFPPCELAIVKMAAEREHLQSLVQTLFDLHSLGLQVDTIPVWFLLQKDDGEFFIPHVPQLREEPFPSNLQAKIRPRPKTPAHLFGPKDELQLNPRSFQFQLGSFVWKLLAGNWPYDIEPLLLLRRENPSRVHHDFGKSLTPVLSRMTSLEPQDRYDDLGLALEELAAALLPNPELAEALDFLRA